jgi:hypothetical protein
MRTSDGLLWFHRAMIRLSEHRWIKAGESSSRKRIAAVKRTRCDYDASRYGSPYPTLFKPEQGFFMSLNSGFSMGRLAISESF